MVLSFGELLLRYAPDTEREWLGNNKLDVYLGGSEFNVATALAKWKIPVSYCTTLPNFFLSEHIIKKIKEHGIDTSAIIQSGNKLGTYYVLKTPPTCTEIIYDRVFSSFSRLKPGMINWNDALNGIRWFHFSTISPGLNKNVMAILGEALEACIKRGITISVDLNYNPKLWQNTLKIKNVMQEILQYCNVITGDIWSAESLLNINITSGVRGKDNKQNRVQQSKILSEEIVKQFPNCKIVATAFRFHEEEIEYYGSFFNGNNLFVSASYKANTAIDRAASGDCFTAGIIYGAYNHLPFQQIINFATAAAFQKLSIQGNATDKTIEEVRLFMQGYS